MTELTDKVSGGKKNNPWKNAYSHASHCDVGTAEDIRKSIKKLSDDFTKKIFCNIDEFNTMPCASIFLSGIWNPKEADDILHEIEKITDCLKGNRIHVVCVTHKSVETFLEYIGLGS